MTEHKAMKRAVRRRMEKTGESYTAARRHVAHPPANASAPKAAPKPAVKPPLDVDLGQTDDAIQKGSGKTWAQWFAILDAWGATERTHTEIARHLRDDHGVGGWYAQAVTVGYERGRGMRAMNQGTKGFYVGVSKTIPLGVAELFAFITDARKRNRWLEPGTLSPRTATKNKSARFDFKPDGSRVMIAVEAKSTGKSSVHVIHEKLADRATVEKMRAYWKERLAALATSKT